MNHSGDQTKYFPSEKIGTFWEQFFPSAEGNV